MRRDIKGLWMQKKGETSKIVQIQRTRKGEDTEKIADSERGKKSGGMGEIRKSGAREESARKRHGKKGQGKEKAGN